MRKLMIFLKNRTKYPSEYFIKNNTVNKCKGKKRHWRNSQF